MQRAVVYRVSNGSTMSTQEAASEQPEAQMWQNPLFLVPYTTLATAGVAVFA